MKLSEPSQYTDVDALGAVEGQFSPKQTLIHISSSKFVLTASILRFESFYSGMLTVHVQSSAKTAPPPPPLARKRIAFLLVVLALSMTCFNVLLSVQSSLVISNTYLSLEGTIQGYTSTFQKIGMSSGFSLLHCLKLRCLARIPLYDCFFITLVDIIHENLFINL